MKLCKNCAYYYPQQGEVCVRGAIKIDPVEGTALYQSARTMREKGGQCGPVGELFVAHPLAWRDHDGSHKHSS